jgi:hypothetical protein
VDIDFGAIGRSILQVIGVGLLFGAGLPALFALGMRSLATVPRGHPFDPDSDESPRRGEETRRARATTAGRVGAVVCFGLCVLVAVFGVVVIIFGKQMFAR